MEPVMEAVMRTVRGNPVLMCSCLFWSNLFLLLVLQVDLWGLHEYVVNSDEEDLAESIGSFTLRNADRDCLDKVHKHISASPHQAGGLLQDPS